MLASLLTTIRSLGWRQIFLFGALLVLLAPVPFLLFLRFAPPLTTSFMIGNAVNGWSEDQPCHRVFYGWTSESKISEWAAISVVAAEDQLFPQHHGFDVDAIRQALSSNQAGRSTRGASTISQQVVKNLFLWSGRSWLRKGVEAYLTVWLELLWPKERILEVYLNIAQFGPCTFGVTAAAQEFFGKLPADLTLDETSRLAAVLPSPDRMSVVNPGPNVRSRAAWIQRQVRQLGGVNYLREGLRAQQERTP